MQKIHGFLLLLLAASQAAAFPCTPSNRQDCPKAPGDLSTDQIPQFITITWDDAVDQLSYGIIQSIVGGFEQRNGCGVPFTYFVTAQNTIPEAVQALYLAGHEIATHTMTHPSYPSAEEIVGARDWLVNATGIPAEKILGFRAPFLLHNAEMRQALVDNGFLYDSSIPDTTPSKISPSLTERSWPYKMDEGIPQDCDTGSCSSSEAYPLYEIPLWAVADEDGKAIASMDPPGDAFENYKRELEWRLTGNRAPLGLFFHAGLESTPERIAELRNFIEYAISLPDVWFVTNQQMLTWMENPVPASEVDALLTCEKPTDISPSVGPVCDTYVSNCQFGSWDNSECRCKCMGEGVPGGYCVDESTGECTKTC